MKIKTKLVAGIAFLFALFVIIGGLGAYFIKLLSDESDQIIEDNYESVEYTKAMTQALDEMKRYHTEFFFSPNQDSLTNQVREQMLRQAIVVFEKNLKNEEDNITESGEKELVLSLRSNYTHLLQLTQSATNRSTPSDYYFNEIIPQYKDLQKDIYQISEVNLRAIDRKNNSAQATAQKVLSYISVIGVVAFIVYFTFFLNFPGYIANPIQELSHSIRLLANKNYQQRLHFTSNDEFGEVASAFNSMAEKLDEYENSNLAKILFDKKRLDTVINNMRDAIIGLDENLRILFINQEATKLMVVNSEEVTGKYAPDIALTNDLMRNLIQDLVTDATSESQTPLKIVVDNKESYFTKDIIDVVFVRTGETNSRKIGYVIVLKNITHFQELNVAKTNFIATISHELKTPISSINLSLKLLEDDRIGSINEEQKHMIDNIKADTQRLLKITRELLDLTQVETGNIQLHFRATKPQEIIDYAYEALKAQIEQKDIQIEIIADYSLPELYIDREKTAWVMINLLSNAIRYSSKQSKIIIRATEENKTVVFSVQDFGKGIDKVYQEKIFERYFRIPEQSNGSLGTGLGLAISKEFITAQGGKIWVESEPEQGSIFMFTIPVTLV
ncbi:ATP-binding protein [Cytophagaceae bacterium YF14B1]|uniref:histidine kinase n=1 Tax=Xanthocytophaga flava TaxID=3048013 RepID=A0AAE3U6P0_9BACT|nr:ATP-binding protein [Xanthocytophaga flavus]MDJ1482069.1 ATP-binding protein [Xanthocytophaga flavus]